MGLIASAANTYYTYKFLRLLTQSWEDTDAYKLGIIDEKGNILIKPRDFTTGDQKSAYSLFHRLVFNIKRLMQKIPAGGSKIASYIAALYLIKESTGMSDDEIQEVLQEAGIDTRMEVKESWFVVDSKLVKGNYTLLEDIVSPSTGMIIAKKGHLVTVSESRSPCGYVLEQPVYSVTHKLSNMDIIVSSEDISK